MVFHENKEYCINKSLTLFIYYSNENLFELLIIYFIKLDIYEYFIRQLFEILNV